MRLWCNANVEDTAINTTPMYVFALKAAPRTLSPVPTTVQHVDATCVETWKATCRGRLFRKSQTLLGNCCSFWSRIMSNEILSCRRSSIFSLTRRTTEQQAANYFAPGMAAKCCDEYVCLSDCLPVCLPARTTRKPHGRTEPNFRACCPWPWLGPPLVGLWYVMYFRFCGWCHIFKS